MKEKLLLSYPIGRYFILREVIMFLVKNFIRSVTAFVMLLSMSAFAADDAINTGRFNDTAIDGYDTVAYFTQNKPVEGNKSHQVKWRDANWYFASEENKALFVATPEKYAPQYGGWCAYAMSKGDTARIDPDAFIIYNDKLYLNYNKNVQEIWLEEKLSNIEKADHFYPIETNVKTF
jgi:YHS domain-containing protein